MPIAQSQSFQIGVIDLKAARHPSFRYAHPDEITRAALVRYSPRQPTERSDQVRNLILGQDVQLSFNTWLRYGQAYRQPSRALPTEPARTCGRGTGDRTGVGI